jgi:glutaredoxin
MKIEACPWCGKDPKMLFYRVGCPACGMAGPNKDANAAAVRAWNRLARLAELGRLVEAAPKPALLYHGDHGHYNRPELPELRRAARTNGWKVKR